jgi:hypothetical protein
MTLEQLLEQKKTLAEKLAKVEATISLEQTKDVVIGKVREALDTLNPDVVKLFDNCDNYILAHRHGDGNGDWVVEINQKKVLKPKLNGSGNGNGNGNFKGRKVTITDETIRTKYNLQPEYDSIRKVALAVGISKDDRHPDQTLKKEFGDVWKALVKA